MATKQVPVYSQEEKRRMRLDVCKSCQFSACNGNQANKCQLNNLVCTIDGKNIISKTNDVNQKCPKGYWVNSNLTKTMNYKPGCGCGK